MYLRAWAFIAAGALALSSGPASAASDVIVYPPAFFAESQPSSALDMVRRLPGFSLDEGDSDVRGLAGAAGNVLIDGERPASKQDALTEILRRIPAASVERIELIRGGVDMQGEAIVANVVRRKTGSSEGQVEAAAFAYRDGRIAPSVRLQHSTRSGERLLEGSLRLYREVEDDKGEGPRRRYDETGALSRDALFREDAGLTGLALKGALEQPLAGGALALHAAFDETRQLADLSEARTFPGTVLTLQTEHEDIRAGEVGANFSRALGEGTKLTLTGVQRLSRTLADERAMTGSEVELFTSRALAGESIARISLQHRWSETLQLEGGLEGAFNVLDGKVSLEEEGASVPLPAANVRVEERRAELSGNAVWQAGEAVSLEAGLRIEGSELRQSGDSNLTKTLVYPKPRLALKWTPRDGDQLRLRVEREVGQLDFEDFTSSASLSSDVVTAGNQDLEPQAAWVFVAAYERRFLGEGAVTLTLKHEAIDNVMDRVPVTAAGEVFDAPGNIGRGRADEVEIAFTLPLDSLGIPGGLFSGEVSRRWTSVVDPTTGRDRPISGDEPLEGEIHFTQDLPAHGLRWGVDVLLAEEELEYHFDEVQIERTGAWLALFGEWSFQGDWRIRLDAANLTSRAVRRVRDIYDGPRNTAAFDYREDRRLDIGPYFGLTVRRSY